LYPYCEYKNNFIEISYPSLGYPSCSYGLPNFLNSLFDPFTFNHTCFNDTAAFKGSEALTLDSLFWNFGDPTTGGFNTSKSFAPKHVFSHAGNFDVKLIRYLNNYADTSVKTVTIINTPPSVNLGNDTSFCPDTTLLLDASQPYSSYLWQDCSTDPHYTVSQPGIYFVIDTNDCGLDRDTISISFSPVPIVNLGQDTTLCPAATLQLDVSQNAKNYSWQDNTMDSVFTVSKDGIYWVDVTNNYSCTKRDSIIIDYTIPPQVNFGKDTAWCMEIPLVLDATNPKSSYLWQDNSTASTYHATIAETYRVRVTNICGSAADTINITFRDCTIIIPNLFTPNDDNYNDVFFIKNIDVWGGELRIYNIWGDRVYSNGNYKNEWSGVNLNDGIYYYYLKDGREKEYKGWVEIRR
jgi:gliding motility-associated-like protein